MEYIHSKDIFLLMRDTLKFIDRRIMDHGSRVAYYVYKMLECKGGYEEYQMADIVLLATLHDIGAYKTDDWDNMLTVEVKEYMEHSIYGYLFFKYYTPMEPMAKVLLYHHMDCERLRNVDYRYKNIAQYINIADRMDVYFKTLGEKTDLTILEKQAGKTFSREGVNLFYQAVKKYDMIQKVKSGEYKQELDHIVDYMIFSNEGKKKYLQMLMYCVGFCSEYSVVDAVTTIIIAEELGNKLGFTSEEMELLYYGALMHDIGMQAIPREIIEAPRKLTKEEFSLLRKHVGLAEKVLSNRMAPEIVQLVAAHHERGDGSGYLRGLTADQMTPLQKVLQIADTVTGLTNKRAYRETLPQEKVLAILTSEAVQGRLDKRMVRILVMHYDEIMARVHKESNEILQTYTKLNQQYKLVLTKMGK